MIWLSELGDLSNPTAAQLFITGGSEVSLSAGTGFALIGPQASQHIAIDTNKIQSKSDGTTAGDLMLNPHGGLTGVGVESSEAGLHVGKDSGQWSNANYGANILISGIRNPALALTDFTGTHFWAILVMNDGTIRFAKMPDLGDISTAPLNHLVIDSTGKMGLGVISPSFQLELSLDSAGKPSTTVWTIVSDERLKTNVINADLDKCYDNIKNIPLKRFQWKDEIETLKNIKDRNKLGWIASDVKAKFDKSSSPKKFITKHAVKEIIPAVLDEKGDEIEPEKTNIIEPEESIPDCLDLNVDQLQAALYGTVQKLQQMIEAQAVEISDLKIRLGALE